jgi:hypothetical protein
VFREKAMTYSTITRTRREMNCTGPKIQKGKPPNFSIDATIRRVLNRDPTASIREIAREARLLASTIFSVLTTLMGDNYRRCQLVPHNLSAQQRNDRLKQIRELLEMLHNAKRLQWKFIPTGDESWFFYVKRHQKLRLAPDSDIPEVARRRINTRKVTILLFWNTSGLHIVPFLAGESLDADYFVRTVLTRYIISRLLTWLTSRRSETVPDSGPSGFVGFFLFGYLKAKMLSLEFDSPEPSFSKSHFFQPFTL